MEHQVTITVSSPAAARVAAGFASKSALAREIGCDRHTLGRLEAGQGVSAATLERWAEAVRLPIEVAVALYHGHRRAS